MNDQQPAILARPDLTQGPGLGLNQRFARMMRFQDVQDNVTHPSTLPLYKLAKRITPRTAQEIQERYGVQLEYPLIGEVHRHPFLATEQLLAEDTAINTIHRHHPGAFVVDVCGNPSRHALYDRRDIWSCMPQLAPGDVLRVANAESAALTTFCRHSFEECNCVVADVLLYTQSLQYYSPSMIAEHLLKSQRRVAYAVVHRFPAIAGEYHKGELTYYRASPEQVVCSLDAGVTTYSHNSLDWLDEQPYITFPDSTGRVLIPTLVSCVGDTYLYMLTLGSYGDDGVAPPKYGEEEEWDPSVLEARVAGKSYSLPSTALGDPSLQYNLTWHQLKYREFRLLPGVMFVTGAQNLHVALSRPILAITVRNFISKHRTAATYASMVRFVNAQYHHVGNLPEEHKMRAVIATVTIAMNSGVLLELSVLDQLLRDNARLWNFHTQALDFRTTTSFSKWDVVAGCTWSALTFLTFRQVGTTVGYTVTLPKHAVIASKSMVLVHNVATVVTVAHVPWIVPFWAIVTAVGAVAAVVRKYDLTGSRHRTTMVNQWTDTTPGTRPIRLPEGNYNLSAKPEFGPTDRVKSPNEILDANSVVIRAPLAPPREERAKLRAEGIVFASVIPTYFASTAENEYVALTTRLALPVPEPEAGLWEQVSEKYAATPLTVQLKLELAEHPVVVNKANANAYASKFSRSMQINLMQSFTEWQARLHFVHEDMITSAFIKIEKADKSTHSEYSVTVVWDNALGAPRIIISMKPTLSVVFGTMMQQVMGTRLRIQLHPERYFGRPFCAVAPHGCSGEILGQWMTDFIDYLGGPQNCVFWDQDAELHDAHTRKDAQLAGRKQLLDDVVVYPPAARQALDAQKSIRGKSHGGVRYKLEWRRGSGFSNTDGENTVITEQIETYAMTQGNAPIFADRALDLRLDETRFDGLGTHFGIAACGDDGSGVASRAYFHSKFGTNLVDAQESWRLSCLALGYKVKPHISYSLDDVDFCSRWWYPTPDGILPGGKIGRVLSRAGWFLECKDAQTIRGAAIGALQDNYHVPFLRQYFLRVLEITVGQKVRGRSSEYSIHMSKRHEYGPETLAFVERKYGLTEKDLTHFEELLAQCTKVPMLIQWDKLDACLAIDSS